MKVLQILILTRYGLVRVELFLIAEQAQALQFTKLRHFCPRGDLLMSEEFR